MADALSPFELLRGEVHDRILKLFRPNKDDDERFLPSGTSKTLLHKNMLCRLYCCIAAGWEGFALDESLFVSRIRQRELHDFLAVLIYCRGELRDFKAFVIKFVLVVDHRWPVKAKEGRHLHELPLTPTEVEEVFENSATAHAFRNSQSYFYPVVLQKNQEVVCERHRPLPYISKMPLGEGSFAKVYAVNIAAGHFRDGQMSNYSNDLLVACKEYRFVPSSEDKSHEQERAVMLEILRTPMKHDNILESYGSLRMEHTYSLFMPLAECDLWDWMIDKFPSAPKTMTQKAEIISYAAWLASGLAFLHDELVTLDSCSQSCFHLDVKPRNILVVKDPGTDQVRWKLSDFNMSRVKGRIQKPLNDPPQLRRARTFSETVHHLTVGFPFKEVNPTEPSRADSTINRRGDGTYIAPEALIDYGGKVGAHSDTWSLGCVLAVVYSYLDGGASSVLEFSDRREEKAEDDRFFSQVAPRSTRKPPRLNEGVERWLKELCMNARKRDHNMKLTGKSERAIVKKMTDFLKDEVLTINPDRRVKAKKVHEELKQTLREYIELEEEMTRLQNSLQDVQSPKKERFLKNLFSSRRNGQAHSDSAPKSKENYHFLDLGLEPGARSCHFSPSAAALVYVYDDELKVYSITEIAQTHEKDALIDLDGERKPLSGSWGAIALSDEYIIATTNRFLFEVSDGSVCIIWQLTTLTMTTLQFYVYQVSNSFSQFGKLTRQNHFVMTGPRISQLAISPDSTYIAFVTYDSVNEKKPGLLIVTTLQEVMSWKDSEYNLASCILKLGKLTSRAVVFLQPLAVAQMALLPRN